MAELDEKFVDVIVNRYMEQAGSAEDVFFIRDGEKIKYSDLKKEGAADEAMYDTEGSGKQYSVRIPRVRLERIV